MMADEQTDRRFVISVLVPDRVGVLRDITQTIYSLKGNIGEIRQTVVCGFFHLIFESIHPSDITSTVLQEKLHTTLKGLAGITVLENPLNQDPPVPEGAKFIVMTRGKDKPGSIFTITSFLVGHGINIEDWFVEQDRDDVVYIAKVVIPEKIDFHQLQLAFKTEMTQKLGLSTLLCHENIFRATNEIGPIKSLLEQE